MTFKIQRDSASERQKQLTVAKLKVSLQEMRDQKEKATKKEDYTEAASIKKASDPSSPPKFSSAQKIINFLHECEQHRESRMLRLKWRGS